MDTFNSVTDKAFTITAWFVGIALAVSLICLPLQPMFARLERRRQQRKAEQAQQRGDDHYRRQLQAATDHAITTAIRAKLAEPVTDLHITAPMRITVGDVVARAHEDFALRVPRRDAAAMLRHRLEHRGHARWPDLITDAFDEEDHTP